jgi:hypothetical protein
MAFNFSPKVVTDGLVLYLDGANTKSYVSGSTTWNDISRGGNNGTLVNGPTFSSTNGGNLIFDGIDDRVEFGNLGALPTKGAIQFWMNSSAVENYRNPLTTGPINGSGGATGNRGIRFEQYTTPSPYGGFLVYLGNDTANTLIGYTSFDYSPSAALTVNTWYHVSIVWDISLSNVIGHLNGVQKFNSTCTTFPSTISSLYVGVGWQTSRYFKGKISQVKIYNRALSATEVLQNYNATKSRYI